MHVQTQTNAVIAGLNEMYSLPSSPDLEESSAQASCVGHILKSVKELGPPTGLDGPGALEALRVSGGYGELPSSAALGSYDPELVSLPSGAVKPVPLEELWGQNGQIEVRSFIDERLKPENEAVQDLQMFGPDKVYSDPKFRSKKQYTGFVARLYNLIGLLDVSLEDVAEEVGLFFVKKKGNKLRMIVDCRRSNRWFKAPEHTNLTTGESLRRIEIGENQKLFVCNADLANAFYTMGMPAELRRYFGLPAIAAKHLGVTEINGVKVLPTQLVRPRLAVLPMGWTWALHWCQIIHERIAERSGLRPDERLQDFRAAPTGSFWHVQYVDNLHVFGTDEKEVKERFWLAVDELKRSGLTVHEEEVCDEGARVLGWEYEVSGIFRPSRQRIWKIRLAAEQLLARGSLSGRELERLMGHITFASLGKREMLSIFGETWRYSSHMA